MNYEKMKKADLIEHILFLKENQEQINISHLAKFQDTQEENKALKKRVEFSEQYFNKWQNCIKVLDSLEEENKTLKEENASLAELIETLNNDANSQRRSLKRRRLKLADMHDKKEEAIQSLFDLYSTVLLENNWNDRINWKNDVLNEIQQIIRQLS